MRHTKQLVSVDVNLLAGVTGGCGPKRCCPPPQPAPQESSPYVSVTVQTGGAIAR